MPAIRMSPRRRPRLCSFRRTTRQFSKLHFMARMRRMQHRQHGRRLVRNSAFLSGLGLAVFALACSSRGPHEVWELPSGYRGWVTMEYSNPDCPAVDNTGFTVTYKIDGHGHGCTSSSPAGSVHWNSYVALDSQNRRKELLWGQWGKGGDLWAGATVWAGTSHPVLRGEYFFMGTEDELKKSWGLKPTQWIEQVASKRQ